MSTEITKDIWTFIDTVVINLCNRYRIPYSEFDDIRQEVKLIFLQSDYMDKYDPDKGTLSHYLRPRIKGAVIDTIRKFWGRWEHLARDGRHKMWPCDVMSYNVESPSEEVNRFLIYDEDTLAKIIAKDLVSKILPRLPKRYRAILKLHYMYGVSMTEIGHVQNVSVQCISHICRRARARARREYARISR